MVEERRRSPRSRVLLGGVLVYGPSSFTADCAIRNLTAEGAQVRLPGPTTVVSPLILIDLSHDKAYVARLAWARPTELGLDFVQEVDLEAPANLTERIVRRLWIERRGR